MRSILGEEGGCDSKIHESTFAGFKHSTNNYSITVICIAASPKLSENHLCSAVEILEKPINPQSSDGLTLGGSGLLSLVYNQESFGTFSDQN